MNSWQGALENVAKRGIVRYGLSAEVRMEALFPILFENRDLLVINKPAGLVCHPTKKGPTSSLIGRLRLYLGEDAEAHMINRLDRETSGLVLVAKRKEGAGFLRKLWEDRRVKKTYYAIVYGHPNESEFSIDAPLGNDEASPVVVKDCVREDGAPSKTDVQVVDRFESNGSPFSLLRVFPKTGRKHQIRIHLSFLGHPLVGDKIYGIDPDAYLNVCRGTLTEAQAKRLLLDCHALHASKLELPLAGESVALTAPINETMKRFCVESGVATEKLPLQGAVEDSLEDRFIEALCRQIDLVQESKRSS